MTAGDRHPDETFLLSLSFLVKAPIIACSGVRLIQAEFDKTAETGAMTKTQQTPKILVKVPAETPPGTPRTSRQVLSPEVYES